MSQQTLVSLVKEQARLHPDSPALVCGDHMLTYAQLMAAGSDRAAALREAGARPGDIVGVLTARDSELVPALLGIVLAGCGYAYLDRRYPDQRLAIMASAAGVGLVLADEPNSGRIKGLRTVPATLASAGNDFRPPPLSPHHPAYICFTSGSQGTPKPVVVPHRAIVERTAEREALFRLNRDSVVLQHLPLSWDVGNYELWMPLVCGAVCVLHASDDFDLDSVAATVLERRVTHTQLTSALLALIVTERPDVLAGLKEILTGGDVASPAHLGAARVRFPMLRLVNVYGPVEATLGVTTYQLPSDRLEWSRRVPIGNPMPGVAVHLLDDDLEPVDPGETGQIYLAGTGLCDGYLGMPGQTAQRFVPDPLGSGRLYRTGDLGRCLPNGLLDFARRGDGQVKIRGYRIEPGEIEAAAWSLPGVDGAVVRFWQLDDDLRIALYTSGAAAAESIEAGLAGLLPIYMRPTWIAVLERLPLSPTGKFDRGALPDPRVSSGAAVTALTGTEHKLAKIWMEVLDVDQVGREDDFFRLGGDSIAVARVLSRVRDRILPDATMDALFAHPTLGALAGALDAGT